MLFQCPNRMSSPSEAKGLLFRRAKGGNQTSHSTLKINSRRPALLPRSIKCNAIARIRLRMHCGVTDKFRKDRRIRRRRIRGKMEHRSDCRRIWASLRYHTNTVPLPLPHLQHRTMVLPASAAAQRQTRLRRTRHPHRRKQRQPESQHHRDGKQPPHVPV